jgi:phage terminase Nu1 subunit (DNA packaging protein)
MMVDMRAPFVQAHLAELVGVSKQAISALVQDGAMPAHGTLGQALQAYCARLREQAAGRLGAEEGGLDLVQERAALAREQRIAQELKNAIARGEYAPIGLLADVLALASSSIVDRFEQLDGQMKKTCPQLPSEALDTVHAVLAEARNEWIKATATLVDASLMNHAQFGADTDEDSETDVDDGQVTPV